jgi:hypothetical protein
MSLVSFVLSTSLLVPSIFCSSMFFLTLLFLNLLKIDAALRPTGDEKKFFGVLLFSLLVDVLSCD